MNLQRRDLFRATVAGLCAKVVGPERASAVADAATTHQGVGVDELSGPSVRRGIDIIHAMLGTDRKREACAAWNENSDRWGAEPPMVWIDWQGWWTTERDEITGEIKKVHIGPPLGS